jgi:hypothetical protein
MLDANEQIERAQKPEGQPEISNLSSMTLDLMQSDLYRQLNHRDSSADVLQNGFPDLKFDKAEAREESKAQKKFADPNSPFATGAELISERELKQAGLAPSKVNHESTNGKDGSKSEKTTVKYPDGLEVTVNGNIKANGSIEGVQTEVTLPKNYSRDPKNHDVILDAKRQPVAQINEDGTVTVKVTDQWVEQSPAGITEATVSQRRDGKGITQIREPRPDKHKVSVRVK